MTQKTINIFMNQDESKPPEKNHATNKSEVHHIDDIWSLDILDLKDYGEENKRGYIYVLVVTDTFTEFRWCIPLRNKNGQTIKEDF